MTEQEFESMLIRHEGERLKPYRDSVGKLTIGVGINITDGISKEESTWLMRHRLSKTAKELKRKFPVVQQMDTVRYYVLLDMAYNMGVPTLSRFVKMWDAIDQAVNERGGFMRASAEMLDSKWSRQVGPRAKELAYMMVSGQPYA